MTIEKIKHIRTHANLARGAYVIGKPGWSQSAGPGGSGLILTSTKGWDSTIELDCQYLRVQGSAAPFGANGYAVSNRAVIGVEPGALFAPFPVGSIVYRFRSVIAARVAQADANNPLSRIVWGIQKEFGSSSPIGTQDYGQGWVCFYCGWNGTTPGNWFCKVVDDAENVRHSFDTGITSFQPHALRIDLDPVETEIRFYIDEVLVSTYVPTSGFMNVTDLSPVSFLGYGVNAGWTAGASTVTYLDVWAEVMCSYSAFYSTEE